MGRAGRALNAAYGILLSGEEETDITDWFISSAFPTPKEVSVILDAFESSPHGLSVPQLMKQVNLSKGRIEKTISLLSLESPAPIVKQGTKWQLTAATLSREFWDRAERLTALRRVEQKEMQDYVSLAFGTHMAYLVRALDGDPEKIDPPSLPPLPTSVDSSTVIEAVSFLRRSSLDIEPRRQWPAGGMPQYQTRGKIPGHLQMQSGKVLCVWGDAGWGNLVRNGKYHENHFSDELVNACINMIRDWNPEPEPVWVTCVPSLARCLMEHRNQPADLLKQDAEALFEKCESAVDRERLQRLLGRGFLLSQAVEKWQSRAVWVLSRADDLYPKRLKTRLREDAPAIIYGCGNPVLLESGGLAVVGSRHVDPFLIQYTEKIGQLAASAKKSIVSGGAKGVDEASMMGALKAKGNVIGVLADSLEKKALRRDYRDALQKDRLVLISQYDPVAGFNVGHAMQRNKLIYTLSDAALVVNSDLKKGGTWAGANEQLNKYRFVPIYVRSTGEPSPGLDALKEKGAMSWPNPSDENGMRQVFETKAIMGQQEDVESSDDVHLPKLKSESKKQFDMASEENLAPKKIIFEAVRRAVCPILKKPKKDCEIATELDVSTAQARQWLNQLVEEGIVKKKSRPVRYVVEEETDIFDSVRNE